MMPGAWQGSRMNRGRTHEESHARPAPLLIAAFSDRPTVWEELAILSSVKDFRLLGPYPRAAALDRLKILRPQIGILDCGIAVGSTMLNFLRANILTLPTRLVLVFDREDP